MEWMKSVALFTDTFDDSELGLIPSGWRVGTISEFGKIVTGRTPSSKNLNTLMARSFHHDSRFGSKYLARETGEPSLKQVQRL